MNIRHAKYDGRKVTRRVKNSQSPRAYRATLWEHVKFAGWRDMTAFVLMCVGLFGAWIWFWYEAFKEQMP